MTTKRADKSTKVPFKERTLIGYSEEVDLPEWGIKRVLAKTDTGARSSAIHVEDMVRIGKRMVRFRIMAHNDNPKGVWIEARIHRVGRVRSSIGEVQARYFVRAVIRVGGVEREIELSLAARDPMRYRMLLGRTALAGMFVVDPGRRMIATNRAKKLKADAAVKGE